MRNLKLLNKLFIIVLLLFPIINYAQLSLNVTTDKEVYEHGEEIHVSFSITNPTENTISYTVTSITKNCQFQFKFNDIPESPHLCDLVLEEYQLTPHSSIFYNFTIIPSQFGVPDKDGNQMISIKYMATEYDLIDTVYFYAPRYLGGQLEVNFSGSYQSQIELIKQQYGITVIRSSENNNSYNEDWQTTTTDIDTLYNILLSKGIFGWIDYKRIIEVDSLFYTDVQVQNIIVDHFKLSEAFPNPFNPSTQFTVELPREANVELSLFNIAGEEVKAIYKGNLSGNVKHTFSINGEGLASGIYFYRLTSQDYNASRKIILLK